MNENTNYTSKNGNFEIAHLTQQEKGAVDKAQNEIKSATGKDLVLIAWEEQKH